MKLQDIQEILEAKSVLEANSSIQEVESCYSSDLISDVLTFNGPKALLLTGLTNAQVIRTAELMDFIAIIFVRGKKPQAETVKLAEELELPLFATDMTMYESCGRLYESGLPGTTRRG